jgi:parallel beta-helix repeat protein
MKWTACLMALSTTVACSGSADSVNPVSPSLFGSDRMDAVAQARGVTRGPADDPTVQAAAHAAAPQAKSVLRVPRQYATIQAAVDAASPGDTIEVSAGLYCEAVSIVGKSDLRLHSQGGRAVITGECVDKLGAGIHVMNAARVEIMGFLIEHFEFGIHLMSVTESRVHLNQARSNRTVIRAGVNPGSRGIGILLQGSNANTVSQNELRDNGRNGITLWGSSGNVVRANRLTDNNVDNLSHSPCNLMLLNGSNDNAIVENEVVGPYGLGIMIGPGVATGNSVKQNRVHGFPGPGIIAMLSAAGNVIEQNNATGNGIYDLVDQSDPVDNTWNRNQGTCGPGVC